jgi:hypothetical protein
MRRRKLVVALAGLAAAFVLGLAFALLPAQYPGPLPEDVLGRIQAGMSLPDIEKIVGFPAGDHRSGPTMEIFFTRHGVYWEDEQEWLPQYSDLPKYTWKTDSAIFEVVFLKSGKVATASFTEVTRQQAGPLELLAWRIRQLVGGEEKKQPTLTSN